MDQVFDQSASRGGDDTVAAAAAWLVADRLSSILHLGDTPLALRLSDQGHEVLVAGPDVTVRRAPEIQYVRCATERLPFRPDTFDVVLVPLVDTRATVLAEHARVLRPGGLLSTLHRAYDESLPWVRRLREIVGLREAPRRSDVTTLVGSGLFEEPESTQVVEWHDLDRDAVLRFARHTGQDVDDAALSRVHRLFEEYAAHTGSLRLRQITHCVRARVLKDPTPAEPPPDTVLFELT